jgi:hypothetical protein
MCEPRRLTTLWASAACYRDSFILPSYICLRISQHSDYAKSWRIGFLFPAGARNSLPFLNIHTVSGAHPTSYSSRTGWRLSPDAKRPERDVVHRHLFPMLRLRGAVLPFPHTSSWLGAFSFTYPTMMLSLCSVPAHKSPSLIAVTRNCTAWF